MHKLENCFHNTELSQKTRFQSVRIAALCLYNIQLENLVFKKSLSTSSNLLLSNLTIIMILKRIEASI